MSALLETRRVSKAFGEFRALEDVSIAVAPDELVSVIGPNGAGKTTLVNLLTGLLEPTAGDVLFRGKSIAGIGPVKLAEQGLARSFQLIAIFPQLTVEETIATALISRQRKRWHLFSRLAADAMIRRSFLCGDSYCRSSCSNRSCDSSDISLIPSRNSVPS